MNFTCMGGMAVDDADPANRCNAANNVKNPILAPANMVWASAADDFSSQYGTTDYAASQTTGVPDVYPSGADEPKAWATLGLDDMNEYIVVSYANPVMAEAVWVYETYNPGAVKKITITTADGDKVIYDNATPMAIGACAHIRAAATMTCSPISKVRVDLASDLVSGWNEIDAIGLLPPKS